MRIRATVVIAAVFLCTASLGSAQTAAPAQAAPAQAAAPPGQVEVTLYGAGGASCGSWLADRNNLKQNIEATFRSTVELNWVLGFLTASENFLGELHLPSPRHTDANAVAAWVDKYCRENPLKNIADASANLVIELSKPQ
jgi:hypothetical protein